MDVARRNYVVRHRYRFVVPSLLNMFEPPYDPIDPTTLLEEWLERCQFEAASDEEAIAVLKAGNYSNRVPKDFLSRSLYGAEARLYEDRGMQPRWWSLGRRFQTYRLVAVRPINLKFVKVA